LTAPPRAMLTSVITNIHNIMYIAAAVLVVLWLVGLLMSYTMGGWIHVLLAVAVILVLVKLFGGQGQGGGQNMQNPTQ